MLLLQTLPVACTTFTPPVGCSTCLESSSYWLHMNIIPLTSLSLSTFPHGFFSTTTHWPTQGPSEEGTGDASGFGSHCFGSSRRKRMEKFPMNMSGLCHGPSRFIVKRRETDMIKLGSRIMKDLLRHLQKILKRNRLGLPLFHAQWLSWSC